MTQRNIVINSRKTLERDYLTLQVDNLEKNDKCFKKNVKNASNQKEKFKDIFRKCVWKKCSDSFLLCGVLPCISSATFKKFHWPIRYLNSENDKKIKKIENNQKFKLRAFY